MSIWKQLTPSTYQRLAFGCAYGMTDVGTVRRSNEDNFLIDPQLGVVAVADGMGGHEGGDVAAHLALEALCAGLRNAGAMPPMVAAHRALDHANGVVYGANVSAGHGDGEGMGTTLTGFWQPAPGAPLVVFHVGDSRLYLLREGELSMLTRDQTMYQMALDAGMEGDYPPRNLLLQAVGPAATAIPDLRMWTPRRGDLYLLCSDGLYGSVTEEAIGLLMGTAGAATLDRCCDTLIALAKAHGSRDNITAVLALFSA